MDLSTLETSAPSGDASVMDVRSPVTDAVTGATISLLGQDSDVARRVQRKAQNRRLRKGLNAKLTMEELEVDAVDVLVSLTVGWAGIEWKGEVLEFTANNARMLYTELRWLRKQVDEFTSDLANYMGNSPLPLPNTPLTSSDSVSQ